MSITTRKSGNVVVFEAPNVGVVAFYTQGLCYLNPVCTSGLKSSVSALVPENTVLDESLTLAEFLELLALQKGVSYTG